MPFETAVFDWRAADRRVEQASRGERLAMERVVQAIVAELRRRIGNTFTTDELAALYDEGTDWYLDIAQRLAPDAPWAWDATVVDAAFHRHLREAIDYAGGRRLSD